MRGENVSDGPPAAMARLANALPYRNALCTPGLSISPSVTPLRPLLGPPAILTGGSDAFAASNILQQPSGFES
jgi:hypothetical protein